MIFELVELVRHRRVLCSCAAEAHRRRVVVQKGSGDQVEPPPSTLVSLHTHMITYLAAQHANVGNCELAV